MNSCKLHLLTWRMVKGNPVPVCPQHPDAEVDVEPSGESDLVITCGARNTHPLNMCSRHDFEAERQEASELLSKLE